MDLWSVIPIGVHHYTFLSTMVSLIPLWKYLEVKSLDILYMLVCISSFKPTTSIHHTSMDILNLELMPCKQTYEMHIQMHHTSSWACSPYLCAQNFSWSLSFVISLPLCHISRYLYVSLPLWYFFPFFTIFTTIFVSLPLCHQWPQRF